MGAHADHMSNQAVVPVVKVVVYFLGTTTGTTFTTMQLSSLFTLSCIFILDDNGDNLYNHAVVPVVYVVVFLV